MSNPWFRLYSRITTDPIIEFLSFEDQRHYVWVLCLKNDGFLDQKYPQNNGLDRVVARKLGLQGEAFENAKIRLVESGLIDNNWQPKSWDELQFKSDSSKERVKAFRERNIKKQQGINLKRECNVTVTAQDTDTDTKKKKTSRFIPPTLKEVQDYCAERKNSVDPQVFLDHYEANGWVRGKTKVKNWQACVRTWERNSFSQGNGSFSNDQFENAI